MLCTAVTSALEVNFFSFIAGVVLTSVLFGRFMVKHRKKHTPEI